MKILDVKNMLSSASIQSIYNEKNGSILFEMTNDGGAVSIHSSIVEKENNLFEISSQFINLPIEKRVSEAPLLISNLEPEISAKISKLFLYRNSQQQFMFFTISNIKMQINEVEQLEEVYTAKTLIQANAEDVAMETISEHFRVIFEFVIPEMKKVAISEQKIDFFVNVNHAYTNEIDSRGI